MKRFFFPLFWKFNIAIVIIVAVFGSINIYLIWSNVYSALERESEKIGRYVSKNLARESIKAILNKDYFALRQLIENAGQIDTTIAYVFILNQDRKILVHTFDEGFPQDLLDANLPEKDSSLQVRLITTKASPGVKIRDITTPILRGKLGSVRIGLLEESIATDVQKSVFSLLLMVALFLLFGIAGAYAFSRFINNPIKEISRVAGLLDFDAMKFHSQPRIQIREKFMGRWKMPWRAEDQLDILAGKFNGMIDRLEKAYLELQAAQSFVIQSEKLASIGTLSAGIAHEINNPISGIQNCIRRITRNPGNMEQNLNYLEMMARAANKIERVVKGLLEYTRDEKFEFDDVDCAEVIERSLLLAAFNLEQSQITVRKDYPPELPKIKGSRNHLQQVLVNLLLNSIDAINEKYRDDAKAERLIVISVEIEDKWISIIVKDSGGGISPELRDKIFDPFFTTKAVGRGTGLGLSVSYKIISSHKGKIEVISSDRKGTKVTILLPLNKAE